MTETLKYKIIRDRSQYNDYCKKLEILLEDGLEGENTQEEIDLLTLLIEKWDEEHNSFEEVDPIQLLHSLMADHKMRAKDLVDLLGVSKGYVSDMLNCKKGLSKTVIRKLSNHFKVSQEAFNRPYKIISLMNARLRNASVNQCSGKFKVGTAR